MAFGTDETAKIDAIPPFASRSEKSLAELGECISNQREFSIVGWFAVIWIPQNEVVAVFQLWSDAHNWTLYQKHPMSMFEIKPIGAKVDFSDEQIQLELSRRCAEREKANAFSNCNL